MPAPYKKKSRTSGPGPKTASRPKHGRDQLRTVTRTARRDKFEEPEPESEEASQEDSEEEQQTKPKAYKPDSLQSYNALLTLLKSDHQEDAPRAKKRKVEEAPSDDEVAGANLEEEPEYEEEEDEVVSDDEAEDQASDPFEVHFNQISDEYSDSQEKLVIKDKQRWSVSLKANYPDLNYSSMVQSPPGVPIKIDNKQVSNLKDVGIKKRILDAYESAYDSTSLSSLDSKIVAPMFNYQDVSFPYQRYNHQSYQKLYVTHALNHIFKTRDRILKNNEKLHNYQANLKEGKVSSGDEPELRDQGFTRPKVLILLPTRNVCYEVVQMLIKLLGSEQQENKKKFQTQFYSPEFPPDSKPDDFKQIFMGNNNDFFSIGMKFTRKSLKLYSSFYSSDIIIGSPIGLSMMLENPDKRKRQYDFLSSIEVLIIDKANSIEMQNWDHVNTVMKYINKIPQQFHDADFSRIRMWSINDQAKMFRQNLIFSEYLTPNINNLISSKSFNLAGKSKFKPNINSNNCIMNSIGLKIKQIFQRFDGGSSPVQNPEARFKFFKNSILPSLMKSLSYEDGLLIYIPSYFDYVRIKDFLKTTKLTFDAIDEYSSQSKVSRARSLFQQGKTKVLLYTERLHHFRRFEIGGVKNVLVYEVPSNPLFYKELVRFIGKTIFKNEADLDLCLIKILFSKWDAVGLERVVGNERAPVLCNSVNEMYEFR